MEKELYKLYHYTFFASVTNGFLNKKILNEHFIAKDVCHALLNKESLKLEIIGYNLDMYLDDDVMTEIEINDDYISLEYFTTDDKYGYERFINWVLTVMAEKVLVRENKVEKNE